MFKHISNTACNNILFKPARIRYMREKKKLHPSMVRLYEIAADHGDKVIGQSALARALNESPQTVKNWEVRGISKGGAIKSQSVFGCDANELLGLTFDMSLSNNDRQATSQLTTPFTHVHSNEPMTLRKNVAVYQAPRSQEDELREKLLELFSQLDIAGKREWLANLSGFVDGRRPHQDGSAPAVAGQK